MKKIIIAEKPSVAKEFAKALKLNTVDRKEYIESDEYIVTWCVGHLVTMSYPEKYDENLKKWSIDTLPFIPDEFKYEVVPSVMRQYNVVSSLLNREDVDTIYVCTDSGREGEYIYRLVDQMSGNPTKNKRRVWIDSQTEEAIINGINDARPLAAYDNLADAAYLRAKEDYLMGINFSRILTLKYSYDLAKRLNEERGVVVAIGRVMTCVLGMIVAREREIRNFIKVKFYKLSADVGEENSKFTCDWKVTEESRYFESPKLYNETGFKNESVVKEFINQLTKEENKFIVKDIKKKNQKENANLLFNLAELQSECTKKFKITPDETLAVAQTLYEKKLTTYPRTDARVLSTAVAKEIGKNLNGIHKGNKDEKIKYFLDKMIVEKYSTKLEKTKYVNDSKITDHYAIIPTGQGFENYANLSNLEKDIYKMIVLRFIAIFYPAAEFSKMSVELTLGNESFFANGKVCLKEGYLELMRESKSLGKSENNKSDGSNEDSTEDDEKNTNMDILKNLKKGMELEVGDFIIKDGETSPPSRYTSGSMILAMENAGKLIEDEKLREQIKGSGIGTSATRAEIIKKLHEKNNYISLNPKTQILTPSSKGEAIYDIVKQSMPDMLNPELTASWEKGLNMVALGEIEKDVFMSKLRNYIETKVEKFKKRKKTIMSSRDYVHNSR